MIDKYTELAKNGNTRPSRFVASVSVILYLYLFCGSFIVAVPMLINIFINWKEFIGRPVVTDSTALEAYLGAMPGYIVTNLSIYCMLLGLFIAIKFIHYRSFTSLITTRAKVQWSKYWVGFAAYGILVLAATAVDYFISSETYSFTFDASRFWIALPIILIMTPIQAATEELVFRGYVIQSFGLKIKNALVLSIISGVIFTLPHMMNPEIFASNKQGVFSTICMILNYFVMGAALAIVTIKTNSLEAAMGAHAVNNLICFILVGYPDSALATNTVFTTTKFEPVSGLVSAIILGVLFYFITAALINVMDKKEVEKG